MPLATPPDTYLGGLPATVEIEGNVFRVNVHLAEVDGRYICVGIDLRSFEEERSDPDPEPSTTGNPYLDSVMRRFQARIANLSTDSPEAQTPEAQTPQGDTDPKPPTMVPTNGRFVEITSQVVRGLRTAEVIEEAQAPIREAMLVLADAFGSVPQYTQVGEHFERSVSPAAVTRRGPKPQLGDEALRDVVAATYRVTAKRPVQAVRRALEESGALRPPVTIDQARKAVAAARSRGFIPPAKKRGQREENPDGE